MFMYKLFGVLIIITVTSAQDGSMGRRVSSFIASRGKKNEVDVEKEVAGFDYESTDKLDDHADDAHYPMAKRAQLGFQGTRGKKSSDLSYKRAMGFTALRGKKYDSLAHSYPNVDLDYYWLLRNELEKRKFYGMRGKKLPYSHNPFRVMGVRGKKGPSTSTFFGTRGKKDDPTVNRDDNSDSIENLATIMYLLSTDRDPKHHSNNVFDIEMADNMESPPQEQVSLLANDASSTR